MFVCAIKTNLSHNSTNVRRRYPKRIIYIAANTISPQGIAIMVRLHLVHVVTLFFFLTRLNFERVPYVMFRPFPPLPLIT